MRVHPLSGQNEAATAPGANANLGQLWQHYARRTSDGALAAMAGLIVPVIVAITIASFWLTRVQPWWPLLLAPALASAFGFWGIADRELQGAQPGRVATAWRVVRRAAVAVAGGCSVVGIILFLRVMLGTWIS